MKTLYNVVLFVVVLFVAFGSMACDTDVGGGSTPTAPSAPRDTRRIVSEECIRLEWMRAIRSAGHFHSYPYELGNSCSYDVRVSWTDNDSGRSNWIDEWQYVSTVRARGAVDEYVYRERGDNRDVEVSYCASTLGSGSDPCD